MRIETLMLITCLCGCVGTHHAQSTATAPTSAPVLSVAPAAGPEVAAPVPVAPVPADERVVVVEGAPAIDPAVKELLSRYTNVRFAVSFGIADDGKGMLVGTRFGETTQLHYVNAPMGARHQLSFEEEPIANARVVPGQPGVFIYAKDVGGAENYQLYRFEQANSKATLLTDGQSRTEAFVVARDGKRIAYTNNARNGRDMDLYLGDGMSPQGGKLVLEREGTWEPVDFSPDGKTLLIAHDVSITNRALYALDLVTLKVTRLSPEAPVSATRDAVFGADSKRVYITSDHEGEFVEAYELSLMADGAPGALRPLTRAIPWNVEQIALSFDGRTLAVVTNEDGFSVLRLIEPKSGRARIVSQVSRGLIRGLSFAKRANVLGFTFASATLSGDAYSYDLARNTLTRWTESELGGLDAQGLAEPELVRVKSFDGREIPAFYYRPQGAGPFPLVIDIHGGPESQARPYFSPMTQYLVKERGIAVLVPNVRGSDGYGKTYLALDNAEKREDSVKDIGAMLDWVATRPELDRKKVGVNGGSYGGYMVLSSLSHYPDRIRAGVDIVGIANFVSFLERTSEYRRDLRRVEYGDERDPDMRRHLEAISPTTRAKNIRSALLVAHGSNDPRVPVGEAEQIVEAVRAQGLPVWTMYARNEGHGFRKKTNRDQLMALTAMFWEQNLR